MSKSPRLIIKSLYIIYIGLVMFFCFYNFSSGVDLSKYFLGIRLDKYAHFVLFFPYPFIAWLTCKYSRHLAKYRKYSIWITFISGLLLAVFTEVVQKLLIPGREGDPYDFLADFIAITLGTIIIHFAGPHIIKLLERYNFK